MNEKMEEDRAYYSEMGNIRRQELFLYTQNVDRYLEREALERTEVE